MNAATKRGRRSDKLHSFPRMKSGPALRTALAFLFVCGVLYLVAFWLESKTDDIKAAIKPKPAAPAVAQGMTGEAIYQQRCLVCHQLEGRGVPNLFPPLAASDFLEKERERSIRALCEGLTGRIRVNGTEYDGAMPAQALDDKDAATVLTYIGTSWGNNLPPFTAEEIASVRAKTKFKTYEHLVAASSYQPLPKPPAGYSVREVARMPENEFPTRFAGDGKSPVVYILTQKGAVWRLDSATGVIEIALKSSDYLDEKRGGIQALGLMLGPDGALWISTNQIIKREPDFPLNEVVIHRTPPVGADGKFGKPLAWLTHSYPHGGGFTHGVSHLAIGPDGMLYVASGSRTDGGERPPNHPLSPVGEVDTTACIWRLDPKAVEPKIEVVARGIRNPYGFAWDGSGNLFTVANGPDANAPEEMDHIVTGRHYGFPYQFSDWPVEARSPYTHTPRAPEGVTFTLPVKNLGPAGIGKAKSLATFDPHSSPAGVLWCGDDFPAPIGGGFLVTRSGNLLGKDRTGIDEDVGFDLLSVHLTRDGDGWTAKTETILAPLGRPLDVIRTGPGRALVLEYTRPVDFKSGLGWLSGRVIELRAGK